MNVRKIILPTKKMIAPIQKLMLQKSLCPGCSSSLDSSRQRKSKGKKQEIVTCSCGRIFIKDKIKNEYRRAIDKELT